jgi:predicted esterase
MGAEVTLRLYPRMGHGINEDEVSFVRALLRELSG